MMAAEKRLPRVKNVDKNNSRHSKFRKPKRSEDPKVYLIAQEIRFAQSLAGNDKKQRDKSLKHLKRWFLARSRSSFGFAEKDLMKIWKGLFYSVWMSDKPLIQEELCESIASLFECFAENADLSVLFFKCCLKTLATEWFGLDQHRMDKFLMFVRRIVRAMFRSVGDHKWSMNICQSISLALSDSDGIFCPSPPVYARNALGLLLHIADVWNEELAKVSKGKIPSDSIVELLRPFAVYLARGVERRLISTISKNVFTYLIKQTDLGIEYEDKADAWRRIGCPHGGIDAMVPIDSDEEDKDENFVENGFASDEEGKEKENIGGVALDPRAGRVDVVLPQLRPDPSKMAALLRSYTSDKLSALTNRSKLKKCAEHFESLADGKYPLVVRELELPNDPQFQLPSFKESAVELFKFEKKVEREADELRLKGLNRKRKRRVLEEAKRRSASGENHIPNRVQDGESDDEMPISIAKLRRKNEFTNKQKVASNGWLVKDVKDTGDHSTNEDFPGERQKEKTGEVENAQEEMLKRKNRRRKKNHSSNKQKRPSDHVLDAPLKTHDANKKKQLSVHTVSASRKTKKYTPEKKLKPSNIEPDEIIPTLIPIEKQSDGKISKKKLEYGDGSSLNKTFESLSIEKMPSLGADSAKKHPKSHKKDNSSRSLMPKVDFTLKNNLSQVALEYYESVRNSPNIPFDSSKKPTKPLTLASKKKFTPKKVNFALKNNSSQGALEYYKSVRNSPNIPLDSSKKPAKSLTSASKKKLTPKKVNFALKNNSSQGALEYYKSVRNSPNIPFDSSKKPVKPLLKAHCTPSPVNPFLKKKLRLSF